MTQIVDISALHAALLYLVALIALYIALTIVIIGHRRSKQIGIGDGGDRTLARWVRAHGNFVESSTFAIPALFGMVAAGAGAWPIHVVGAAFLIGRVAHAQGLASAPGATIGRAIGMVLTFLALVIAGGVIVGRLVLG